MHRNPFDKKALASGRRDALVALALLLGNAAGLHAQTAPAVIGPPDSLVQRWPRSATLVTIGSPADEMLRARQILGQATTAGYLIRSTRTLSSPPANGQDARAPSVQFLAPEVRSVWNSDLPFSLNEGTLWAGRGLNVMARAGVRVVQGPVQLILAPELAWHQNLPFQVLPSPLDDRHPFASPWYTNPESADLPLRFGPDPFTTANLGQSSLAATARGAEVGFATENQWWGPGIRNALIMSTNAPGFPHVFLRTAHPLRTRAGDLEATWSLGRLAESAYFDTVAANDYRSLSAVAFTYRPRFERTVTVGFARVVFSPLSQTGMLHRHAFRVFTDVGRPNDRPLADFDREPGPDQIFALFGRWVLPESGFEAYAEWARHTRPKSIRDFLVAPHHTQGYVLGSQWARPFASGGALRVQAELTNLQRSSTYRHRRATSFYVSRPVLQGYTHQGRVIGAGIGPGATGVWIAVDYLDPRVQLGTFGGWIRWDDDTFFRIQSGMQVLDHDVTIYGGVRAAGRIAYVEVATDLMLGERLNYLYQNPSVDLQAPAGVDIRNLTLRFTLRPALPRRGVP